MRSERILCFTYGSLLLLLCYCYGHAVHGTRYTVLSSGFGGARTSRAFAANWMQINMRSRLPARFTCGSGCACVSVCVYVYVREREVANRVRAALAMHSLHPRRGYTHANTHTHTHRIAACSRCEIWHALQVLIRCVIMLYVQTERERGRVQHTQVNKQSTVGTGRRAAPEMHLRPVQVF